EPRHLAGVGRRGPGRAGLTKARAERDARGRPEGPPPTSRGRHEPMTEHVRMFVDGDWVDAENGAVFDAFGPSTGAVVGSVAEGARGDAQRAIDAANRAWPAWAARSVFERA